MAASISEYIHRIGEGSSYDAEMKITEDIVNAYKYKKNEEYQDILYSYYIYSISSYFKNAKEYIHSETPFEDSKAGSRMLALGYDSGKFYQDETTLIKNVQNLRDNFHLIQNKYNDFLSTLNENYKVSKVVNPSEFMNIFRFIGFIFCCYPIEKLLEFKGKKERRNYYPLPNDSGLFSINSYMYAIFEGIYLIGIPKGSSHFDGEYACSSIFMDHDYQHSNDVDKIDNYDFFKFKELYINILSSTDFSKEEKELHILLIWFLMHEIDGFEFNFYLRDDQIEHFINIDPYYYNTIPDDFIISFSSDFERFSKFTIPYFLNKEEYLESRNPKSLAEEYLESRDPKLLYYISFKYSFEIIRTKFSEIFEERQEEDIDDYDY
jgi:hypothetical protein